MSANRSAGGGTTCAGWRIRTSDRLVRDEFRNGAIGLIDRLIRIRGRRGVGIGNRDAMERLSADLARRLPGRPIRIPERVVFVGIAVGPPVHGDGDQRARGLAAGRTY